jgi:hypothetical protein
MGASDYVVVNGPQPASYTAPLMGQFLARRIAGLPDAHMQGREMRRTMSASSRTRFSYVRAHPGTEILSAILYWMGVTVHFEERCPGPLENGFVRRVQRDVPDAVEQMFAAVYRQHPNALN